MTFVKFSTLQKTLDLLQRHHHIHQLWQEIIHIRQGYLNNLKDCNNCKCHDRFEKLCPNHGIEAENSCSDGVGCEPHKEQQEDTAEDFLLLGFDFDVSFLLEFIHKEFFPGIHFDQLDVVKHLINNLHPHILIIHHLLLTPRHKTPHNKANHPKHNNNSKSSKKSDPNLKVENNNPDHQLEWQ